MGGKPQGAHGLMGPVWETVGRTYNDRGETRLPWGTEGGPCPLRRLRKGFLKAGVHSAGRWRMGEAGQVQNEPCTKGCQRLWYAEGMRIFQQDQSLELQRCAL